MRLRPLPNYDAWKTTPPEPLELVDYNLDEDYRDYDEEDEGDDDN